MSEEDAIETLSHFSPLDCGMRESQAIEIILNLIEEKKKKKADELKKEYKGLKGILEEDRDDYNYYSGMIDGINNLLIEFMKELWSERSKK